MTERPWWLFRLPDVSGLTLSPVHVPADTEAEAREALRRNCYPGAPVDEWPCVGSRFAARDKLWRRT